MKKYIICLSALSICMGAKAQFTDRQYIPNSTTHTVTVIPSSSSGPLDDWYKNLQKYWFYRYRLVNDYMVIGTGAGESIPCQSRDWPDASNPYSYYSHSL